MQDEVDQFKHIPLLAPKALSEFTPAEFKAYVRSLNYVKPKRLSKGKTKAAPKPVSFTVTKKGVLSVRIKRNPKWISRAEIETISKESGRPLNEVWLKLVGPKGVARLSTGEDEERIARELAELPF